MLVSPATFVAIFAPLLLSDLCSASTPPPKRHRPVAFTDFAQRLQQSAGDPAKGEEPPPTPSDAPPMTVFRLPTRVRPLAYALKMVTDQKRSSFLGEVKINVSMSESTHTVMLHSHHLAIDDVSLFHGTEQLPATFKLDPPNQLLNIRNDAPLAKNEVYEIHVKFNGTLDRGLMGIYLSSSSTGNDSKYVVTTQFEPTQARQAFPCFDEPHFRATFDISIARYQHEIALSNMPLISESSADPSVDNRVWSIFERTPPMPTYLVAMVVAEDYAVLPEVSEKFKLWAQKDGVEDFRYAQSLVPKTVQLMEESTGIEYSLPKLNIIPVQDFYRGAMENWGLMIFKSNEIRYDEMEDDVWIKQNVLIIVLHETIHQWFGNYVTINWWDSIWLKEGFAVLYSYLIGGMIEPTWKLENTFIYEVKVRAMESDGLSDNVPMTNPVKTPDEIQQQFNDICYEKAPSVLRMLSHMVSPATFQRAVNQYLRSGHAAGGVTSEDDLWAAMDKQLSLENRKLGNGLTVGQTMKSWTHQVGYPIIKVSRYNKGNLSDIGFQQERFEPLYEYAEVKVSTPKGKEQEWVVPLSCTTGSNPDFNDTRPKVWLLDKKELILPEEVGKNEWIVCNTQQTGYYRLCYDEENWQLIADSLHSSPQKIHPYNRHQIFYDVFTLAKARMMKFSSVFKILRCLENEEDGLIWETVTPLVDNLLQEFKGTEAHELLEDFFRYVFHKIFNKIGFHEKSDDSSVVKNLRPHLLPIICDFGNRDCLSKATQEFNKYDRIDRVPPYLKYTAISAALKVESSSNSTWKKLRDYYMGEKKPIENNRLVGAFRSLRNESIVKKFLSELAGGHIDIFHTYLLGVSLNHYDGAIAALHFVQEILPIMSTYNTSESVVIIILTSIKVKTQEQMNLKMGAILGHVPHLHKMDLSVVHCHPARQSSASTFFASKATSKKMLMQYFGKTQVHGFCIGKINGMLEDTKKLNLKIYRNIYEILAKIKTEAEPRVKALEHLSTQIVEAFDTIPGLKITITSFASSSLEDSPARSSIPPLIYGSTLIILCFNFITLTGLILD